MVGSSRHVHVVLHVRRGDSRGQLPLGYYASAIASLQAEMGTAVSGARSPDGSDRAGQMRQAGHTSAVPLLFRVQTDGKPSDVEPLLSDPQLFTAQQTAAQAHASSSVPDATRRFGLGSRAVTRRSANVVVDYSRNESLALAFHRMVDADVLVMSRSSLSMAAALLSNGTVLFPACWRDRRPLPHWRLWPCASENVGAG